MPRAYPSRSASPPPTSTTARRYCRWSWASPPFVHDAAHEAPTWRIRADKAYHSADRLAWLRSSGIVPRIARPGIESSEHLGRHRWKIERSISWLFGYRRLTVRYERKGSHFLAFLGLAAALTCYKKLAKLTT